LLLEPQRTNVLQYSEQIDNAYWTKSNVTITANQLASPDGTTNADLVTLSAGTSTKQFYSTSFTAITTAYSYSVFAKKGTHNFIQLLEGSTITINFDLNLGTFNSVSGTSGKIEDYGNGWYRCTMFGTGAVSPVTIVNVLAVDSLTSPRGQATSSTGTFYAWGAQIEEGAYATSYIPTLGASVTRVADVSSKTGVGSLIGTTEGAFFIDFIARANVSNSRAITITGGSQALLLFFEPAGTGNIGISSSTSGLTYIEIGGASDKRYKIAYAWKANDYALYVNGVSLAVTQAASTFTGLDRIDLNQTESGSERGKTIVSQLLLFKTRLTNDQLAELTA
jgi:hypothetical protein